MKNSGSKSLADIARVTKRKVKKLKSPKIQKMYEFRIDKKTSFYSYDLEKFKNKLKEFPEAHIYLKSKLIV